MFKALFDKEKREAIREPIEVAFAVLTIVSFVAGKVQKHRAQEDETPEVSECKKACEQAS